MDTYTVKCQIDLQKPSDTHDNPVNVTIYILQLKLINNAFWKACFPRPEASLLNRAVV